MNNTDPSNISEDANRVLFAVFSLVHRNDTEDTERHTTNTSIGI